MDALLIEQHIQSGRVEVFGITSTEKEKIEDSKILKKLGPGEKETIFEAHSEGCVAILDDSDSRSKAELFGTSFVSSPTILIEALTRKLINLEEFNTLTGKLSTSMNMSADKLLELFRIGREIWEGIKDG